MKKITEAKARRELINAIHHLDYEGLAQVYSCLIENEAVVVTPDGDRTTFSSVYQGGHYLTERCER